MYERFTDRAGKVMLLANAEAQRLNHEYIGTEHILLGLIAEGSGVAATLLKNLDVNLQAVRREVERFVQRGSNAVTTKQLPLTPRSKQVIVYAMEESRKLGHNYVGTEHLLLGLVREVDGVAAQVLLNLGFQLDELRLEVLAILGQHDDGQKSDVLETPKNLSLAVAPRIGKQAGVTYCLIAVDIGNSGIKLGQFVRDGKHGNVAADQTHPAAKRSLPEPIATFELPIAHDTGLFDPKLLADWCEEYRAAGTQWLVATVHRRAGALLVATIADWARGANVDWPIRCLTYRDVPLTIRVEEPARVGIDRLLAAVAANRLRQPDRAAIIIDLGTAITVDLLTEDGSFAGGAILPGIAMSSRALAEQTDALPLVAMEHLEKPRSPLGKSTEAAIQAGLYWGVVGAIRELVSQLASGLSQPPELFVTGGASQQVVELLGQHGSVRHTPHLVLAGIALVDAMRDKG